MNCTSILVGRGERGGGCVWIDLQEGSEGDGKKMIDIFLVYLDHLSDLISCSHKGCLSPSSALTSCSHKSYLV
jgi:hypothetical protein